MKILITAPYNDKGQKLLTDRFGEVVYKPWKPHGRAYNEQELIELLRETQAEALITEHDHVTAKVIEAFPRLQFIGVCRGTPSNVSLEAASKTGIPVFRTPARNAQAVAEMFIANVITLLRNTVAASQSLAAGKWQKGAHASYLEFKGNELAGKTIGIIGFGAIGQLIAKLVENYPCTIRYYDPYYTSDNKQHIKSTIKEVFENSDIVSVHLPANEHTKGMIGKDLFSKMKSHAIFVNTARASVVKRDDLLEVLENKKIRGAVLDVFDNEPPDETDYRIIRLENVLATPHIAGATFEVEDRHVDIMNERILRWARDHEQYATNKKEEEAS